MVKVAFNITEENIDDLINILDDAEITDIEVMLILPHYTKRDLTEMIQKLEIYAFEDKFPDLHKRLNQLLEFNRRRERHEYISWKDTRCQTSLEEFFEET